jgi:hypothetical protein
MSIHQVAPTGAAVNTTSTAVQVPPRKDRLAQVIDTAQQLQIDAWRLKVEIFALKSDLEEIIEDPAVSPDSKAALDAACDAVTWLDTAAGNVDGELEVLVCHLQDAFETRNTD